MGNGTLVTLTILNLDDPNPGTAAATIFGELVDVNSSDPDVTVYSLVDPSGSDDSILTITIDARDGSE